MTRFSEQENGSENELHDPGIYCTGVGCRVVRGPDWKWNKQVFLMTLRLFPISFVVRIFLINKIFWLFEQQT